MCLRVDSHLPPCAIRSFNAVSCKKNVLIKQETDPEKEGGRQERQRGHEYVFVAIFLPFWRFHVQSIGTRLTVLVRSWNNFTTNSEQFEQRIHETKSRGVKGASTETRLVDSTRSTY